MGVKRSKVRNYLVDALESTLYNDEGDEVFVYEMVKVPRVRRQQMLVLKDMDDRWPQPQKPWVAFTEPPPTWYHCKWEPGNGLFYIDFVSAWVSADIQGLHGFLGGASVNGSNIYRMINHGAWFEQEADAVATSLAVSQLPLG